MEKSSKEQIMEKIKNKQVYLKIHSRDNTNIYAFSDPELLGKTLRSKKLTFFVNPAFYGPDGAELIPLDQALNLLQRTQVNSNIVGRLAYYASKVGIVNPRSLIWIHDEKEKMKVPHLMTMKI